MPVSAQHGSQLQLPKLSTGDLYAKIGMLVVQIDLLQAQIQAQAPKPSEDGKEA